MSTSNAEDDLLFDVCVVGAGIGGLAVSLALAQQGVQRVLLVERDAHFFDRKQGYGLTLTNSLHGPLARLGLLEQCIEKNCPSQSHYTFDAQGEVLGYYGRVLSSSEAVAETFSSSSPAQHHRSRTQGGNRGNLRVPRQELRQMMLDALQSAQREHSTQTTMLWGHRLVDYEESEREVAMTFSVRETVSAEDGTEQVRERTVRHRACVLLGADGLRSRVRELRDEKQRLKDLEKTKEHPSHVPIPQSPLRYLGVSVIIGIAPISHPLLTHKGFYVLDGENRLFTMPYFTPGSNDNYRIAHKCTVQSAPSSAQITHESESDAHKSSPSIPQVPSRADASLFPASVLSACSPVTPSSPFVMWQLSFSGMSEEEALSLKSHTPFPALLETALRRVEHMFPAVHTLIANTLHSREAWATPLYDRENMAVVSSQRERERRGVSQRVTVLGDAAHPMSMFKGQGANMALEDAVLFASYLAHGKSPSQLDKEKDRERRKEEERDREGKKKRMRMEEGDAKESDRSTSEKVLPAHAHPREHENPVISLNALPRSVICTRICNFEREMVARAGVKAQSSRAAALRLHSPLALQDKIGLGGLDEVMKMAESERMSGGENDNVGHGDKEAENVQGKEVKSPTEDEVLAVVLQRLREKGVNATLGEVLDQKFRETIIDAVREVNQ